jgi:Ca-activated chloride channel family protein
MLNDWNICFWEYEFLAPKFLWLLGIVPVVLFFLFKTEKNRRGDRKYTGTEVSQEAIRTPWIEIVRSAVIYLNGFILCLLIVAFAQPYNRNSNENLQEEYKNGIDIVLAIDVSMSMLARDFQPNRLEASKVVAKEFVDQRQGDRIGLVVYAGEAYTACPSTLDYSILKEQIDQIHGENLEPGTAIGTGLGTAVTRLRSDSLTSKVIILLTDGSNNFGDISPEAAADLAKAKNVRVYTIGVGTNGQALSPVITPFGIRFENVPVEIDEVTLSKIANKTGGKYFRALDESGLKEIYREIDTLERRRMLSKEFKAQSPATPSAFLNWALVIALLSWLVKTILFRTNE